MVAAGRAIYIPLKRVESKGVAHCLRYGQKLILYNIQRNEGKRCTFGD